MSNLNPIGLADLIKAWRRLQGAVAVEEVAEALGMAVLPSLEPPPEPLEWPPETPVEGEDVEPWRDTEPHRDLEPSTIEFDIENEPDDTETTEADVAMVAEPLDPDPVERELPRPPLFAPRLVRDLVRRTLSTDVVSRSIDTERLVESISRGRPLCEIPRKMRLSLRRGVQILRDIGESMEPYLEDQLELVAAIRNLIGENRVEELRCAGVPGTCWNENGRTTYASPIDGRPILVLTDAGIGQPPDAEDLSRPYEWLEFLRGLGRSGSPVVIYLPYRKSRWPRALRTLADAHHWDRPVLPKTGRSAALGPAVGGDESAARQLVLAMQARLPGVVDLATCLALAARIEPGLLRRARLQLVPWVGAGGEADLVFSDLVESRSSECCVLWAPAQRLLQRQLAAEPERLKEVANFLKEFRTEQQAPMAILVEEEVNRLYCEAWAEAEPTGSKLDTDAMERTVAPALASLREGGDRAGLANWALRADSRFPPELRSTPTALALRFTAGRQVGAKAIPADLLDEGAERIRALGIADLNTVPVGVRWRDEGLVFTDPQVKGDPKILLPDTHPRVFWLDPPSATERPGKRWLLDAWDSVKVPAEQLPRLESKADEANWPEVWIRTLSGDRWVLKATESTGHQSDEAETPPETDTEPGVATSTVFSLEVLSASHGDAFLLHYGTPPDPRLILIDGGPPGVYSQVLRPRLEELRRDRSPDDALPIDLIVLSHLDDPQSRGILDLVQDLVQHHNKQRPDKLRVKQFWHNSVERLFGPESTRSGELDSKTRRDRDLMHQLEVLGLPLNSAFEGGPIVAGARPVDFGGGLRIQVICPTGSSLPRSEKASKDMSVFNLTSLVLLIQWRKKKMLLTADARGDHIVDGLTDSGWLGGNSHRLHLDVLQLPHQGSDRNVTVSFFESITADHYVVTGDGRHGKPDLATFESLFKARGNEPFTLHFSQHPGNYRDGYPSNELLRLFGQYRDRGSRFELKVPAPQTTSLLIDFGESEHLAGNRTRRGVTLAPERSPEPILHKQPLLLNRLQFQMLLKDFAAPEPQARVAIIRGPKGSGKSYSWLFVEQAARDAAAQAVRIDLSDGSEGPVQLVRELSRAMQLQIDDFSYRTSVASPRLIKMLHDRFMSRVLETKATWWIVVDGCDAVEQFTFEFLVLLARSLVDGSVPNLRLILLGLERDLPSEIAASIFMEELSPLSHADVADYLARQGLSGAQLDEIMKTVLGELTGPLVGENLRWLNNALDELTHQLGLEAS